MALLQQKPISFVKIFIHHYEFRKAIIDNGNNTYEGYVSISYDLLTDYCDLFKYFREHSDEVVRQIARTYNVRLIFNKQTGKIKIYNKIPNIESNYIDLKNAIEATMDRIKKDMNYLYNKNKLPINKYNKRNRDNESESNELSHKIQKTVPNQPQQLQNSFPGLVMVIDKPSPELVSKLFTMNINYTFLPEFLIKQMLNINTAIPPPIQPSPSPMSHIPPGVLPAFVQNGHHDHREEGEI